MNFGSICSGIEAASVAWGPLGWHASWLSEIEAFPSAVLAHHYPTVPNLGDMTAVAALLRLGAIDAPDVLCGGTPCQAFSVAGLRASLDDARGNLTLAFCRIANALDARRADLGKPHAVIVWENVPGVLSTSDNAFGCFLGELAGEDGPLVPPGGKWLNAGRVLGPSRTVAWRVLDAQYFGVAQRRRRVFVVASARNGFDPTAVLFEQNGLRRDTPPSREAREAPAGTLDARAQGGGFPGSDGAASGPIDVSPALNACGTASGRQDFEIEAFLLQPAHTLRGEGFDASEDGTGRGTPLVPVAFPANLSGTQHASTEGLAPAMGAADPTAVANGMAVRRLTPRECERLQGFPDDYTLIPWRKKPASECPDGPRYKAMGNSWAVPVVRWIGLRVMAELAVS